MNKIFRKKWAFIFLSLLCSFANAANVNVSTPTLNGTFTISWTGARTYVQLYEIVNGTNKSIPGSFSVPSGYYSTQKAPGTYYFLVKDFYVYNGGAPTSQDTRVTVIVSAAPIIPVMPPSINVYPNSFSRSFNVSWGESTGASTYELYNNGAFLRNVNGLSTSITDASFDTSYTFSVKACNSAGCSSARTAGSSSISEPFILPSSTLTASFNLQFLTPPGYSYVRIDERIGSGNWSTLATVAGSAGYQSYPLSRSNSTYQYVLYYCVQISNCPASSQVKSIQVAQPAPTVTAHFDPATVNEEGMSRLYWSSTGATTCTVPGVSGNAASSGNIVYPAPTVMSANQIIRETVTCTGGGGMGSAKAELNVNWINDAPAISSISDALTDEDVSTAPIRFTVGDEETAAVLLGVTARTDNPSLVASWQFTNNGIERLITITPKPNQFGSATMYITVTDANGGFTEQSFKLTVRSVDDAPIISIISDITLGETKEASVAFTVSDIDSPIGTITASTNNPSIATATVTGSGGHYTVVVKAGRINTDSPQYSTRVTISTPYLSESVTRSFNVAVTNLAPEVWIEQTSTRGQYYLSWDYGTYGVHLYENGVDVTALLAGASVGQVAGRKLITKTTSGKFTYAITDCIGSQSGLTCGSTPLSQKTISVEFPVIVAASFSKSEINENNIGAENTHAKFNWSSENSTSCSASGINGVSATSGEINYTAPSILRADQNLIVTVTCEGLNDTASAQAAINLKALNDAPTVSFDQPSIIVPQGEVFYLKFNAFDEEDLADIDLVAISGDASKVIDAGIQIEEINSQLQLKVTPLPGAFGNLSISLVAKDKNNISTTAVANVTINPRGTEGHSLTFNVPSTSTTGNFDITWSEGQTSVEVYEVGNPVALASGGSAGLFEVRGKPPGTYRYYANDCIRNMGGANCKATSIRTIVVTNVGVGLVDLLIYPPSDKDGDFMVTWSAVTGATHYELQQEANGLNWQDIFSGARRDYSALIDPGAYRFRVRACDATACSSVWKEGGVLTVTGRNAPTTSRTVYIHTDAQGSPSAETDESGNENE